MSWALTVCASNTRNTLSIDNFPSLGGSSIKKHVLNPRAVAWTPPTPPPSTEPPTPQPPVEPLTEEFGELSLSSGIRLGGGVFGPARVEGRATISRKTVFKPNAAVQAIMENMGWIPGMGLGARLQGILVPIDTDIPKNVRFNVHNEEGRGGIGY